MRMLQIEIDEEVHSFLKSRAEELLRNRATPFIDATPNGILRRELLSLPQASPAIVHDEAPEFPRGLPLALQQIIEVVRLVRSGSHSRTEANHAVAHARGVAPATVLDKYTRQLGLTASQFDEMIGEENLPRLRTLLHKKFPGNEPIINAALNAKRGA